MAQTTVATREGDPTELELPFTAGSARVARSRLIEWLNTREGTLVARDERCEDARLVVSELVGNSIRHARPLADGTVRVAWAAGPTGLDIAVTDGGARTAPEKVDAGASDLAGRGLAIVETLAARWWVESTRTRTTVHALLTLP